MEQTTFQNLLQRIRNREEDAAAELIHLYEPQIRRIIRVRLTDQKLRRQIDSLDICQSVLGNFFARAALGQYDLQSPEELIKLLARMARNRLIDKVSELQAAKRDVRRVEGGAIEDIQLGGFDATASRIASGRELLDLVRSRLSPDELQIAELRSQNHSWAEIADKLGGKPDAVRVKLSRALDRVTKELKLTSSMIG